MSGEPSGQALLAAAAGGSRAAQEQLFASYFDRLYGFFRMALTQSDEAESAAVETLALAIERRTECLVPAPRLGTWLIDLAVERVAATPLGGGGAPVAARRAPRAPAAMERLLSGIPDRALAALVRALHPHQRQAVVLTVMAGLDDERTAAVLGVSPAQARDLREQGLGEVCSRLAGYQGETEMMGRVARESAYHLRPRRGPLSDGIVVIHGTRAHVERGPANGFLHMALKALERLFHKLMGDEMADEVDEVGGPPRMPERPKATPGAQAFRRPKRTPSLTEYQMPQSTPGMPGYRTPRTTPSTARLSNPSRPPGRAAATYGSRRYGR